MNMLGRKFIQVIAKAVVPLVLKAVIAMVEESMNEDINKDGVIGFAKNQAAASDGNDKENV